MGSRIMKHVTQALGKVHLPLGGILPTKGTAKAGGERGTHLDPDCNPPRAARQDLAIPATPSNSSKTKFQIALEVAGDEVKLKGAINAFREGFYAKSNQAPHTRRRQDALQLAERVAKGPPFPLSVDTIHGFSAALKVAGFKSAKSYLTELKMIQLELDMDISTAARRALELAKRSLNRNAGPARRAPEAQLEDFDAKGKSRELVPNEVAFPYLTYALALVFMLRGIELEELTWEDVFFGAQNELVSLFIKSSKVDQRAQGATRTLGCTCKSRKSKCPVELIKKLKMKHELQWPGSTATNTPVLRDSEGRKPPKATVAQSWSNSLGKDVQGHSPRRSGAMLYATKGMSVAQIAFLGRWNSGVVYIYAEEALSRLPANQAGTLPCRQQRRQAAGVVEDKPAPEPVLSAQPPVSATALSPKWVFSHGRSKVQHLLNLASMDGPSASWRTKCGWPFARGSSHFTLTMSPSPRSKCGKCRCSKIVAAASQSGSEVAAGTS